jgi:hypothetical protein
VPTVTAADATETQSDVSAITDRVTTTTTTKHYYTAAVVVAVVVWREQYNRTELVETTTETSVAVAAAGDDAARLAVVDAGAGAIVVDARAGAATDVVTIETNPIVVETMTHCLVIAPARVHSYATHTPEHEPMPHHSTPNWTATAAGDAPIAGGDDATANAASAASATAADTVAVAVACTDALTPTRDANVNATPVTVPDVRTVTVMATAWAHRLVVRQQMHQYVRAVVSNAQFSNIILPPHSLILNVPKSVMLNPEPVAAMAVRPVDPQSYSIAIAHRCLTSPRAVAVVDAATYGDVAAAAAAPATATYAVDRNVVAVAAVADDVIGVDAIAVGTAVGVVATAIDAVVTTNAIVAGDATTAGVDVAAADANDDYCVHYWTDVVPNRVVVAVSVVSASAASLDSIVQTYQISYSNQRVVHPLESSSYCAMPAVATATAVVVPAVVVTTAVAPVAAGVAAGVVDDSAIVSLPTMLTAHSHVSTKY